MPIKRLPTTLETASGESILSAVSVGSAESGTVSFEKYAKAALLRQRTLPQKSYWPDLARARSHALEVHEIPSGLYGTACAHADRMTGRASGAMVMSVGGPRASALRHVRPIEPLHFPSEEPWEEHLGQSKRHLRLCKALYEMVVTVCCAGKHTVGADQFVYYDASNAKRVLAPDVFVTLDVPDHDFDSYLVWEEGTPELAFEVLSPSDTPERWTLREKLRRYQALGVRELVIFNVDARPGKRLRVWDRIEQDLVERVVTGEKTPCTTLGVTLLVGPIYEYPAMLRIARDTNGEDLVLAAEELASANAAKADAYAAKADAYAARADAYAARIAELEKALGRQKRRRRGGRQ